jgi:hypothetical protein
MDGRLESLCAALVAGNDSVVSRKKLPVLRVPWKTCMRQACQPGHWKLKPARVASSNPHMGLRGGDLFRQNASVCSRILSEASITYFHGAVIVA